ncbi:MAG: tetratricopeptide repeat protein [bacterium]
MHSTPAEAGKHERAAWYLGLILFVLAVHLPSLWVPFQFDDFHHIDENPAVESISNIPDFFQDPSLFSSRSGEGMYRPVLMSTHALNYALFGSGPMGFRAVNLFLHLVNAIIVLSLLRRWTGNLTKAGLGALFWSGAAIQHVSAGYISARSTLLAALFMLIALWLTTGNRKKLPSWGQAILFSLFYVLALLTKEIAFVLPLLLLIYDITLGRQKGTKLRSRLPVYIPAFSVMIAYPFFRMALFEDPFAGGAVSRLSYFLTQPEVFFYYLSKTFFPVNLTLMLDKPLVEDPFTLPVMAAVAGVLFIIAAAIYAFRKAPAVSFGIFFALICLAPTSTVVPLFLVASIERMYLPLLGLLMVPAYLADVFFADERRKKRAAIVLACLVIGMNGLISVSRHLVWQSGATLMRDMILKAPEKSTPWTWLGIMEMEEKRYQDSREHLFHALRINPHDSVAHQTLGEIDLLEGNYQKAGNQLRMLCLADSPQSIRASSCVKLSMAYLKQDELQKAEKFSSRALSLEKKSPDAHYVLGRVHQRRGNKKKARQHYLKAISIGPDFPEVETQLGILARERGDLETARRYLEGVAEKGHEWSEVYFNLGMLEGQKGNLEKARNWFEKSIKLTPEDPYSYYGMGIYHAKSGNLEKARDYFEKAIRQKPDFAEARDFLAKVYLDLARGAPPQETKRKEYLQKAAVHINRLLDHGQGEARKKEWEKTAGRPLP